MTQDSYEGEADNPLSQNGYTYVENNPVNYSDPTGHKKKLFAGAINKAASKIMNSFKQAVSSIYSGARIAANIGLAASSIPRGARVVTNTMYNICQTVNTISGGVAIAGVAALTKKIAAQTAFVGIAYAKATGNGARKTKEAANLLRNWNKAMEETWTKFCKTAPKAKKAQTAKEKEKEQLERFFGKANKDGMYYVPFPTNGGTSPVLMSPEGAKQYINSLHNKDIKKELAKRGLPFLVLAAIMLAPQFSVPKGMTALYLGDSVTGMAAETTIVSMKGFTGVLGTNGLVIGMYEKDPGGGSSGNSKGSKTLDKKTPEEINKMSTEEMRKNLPDGWKMFENNGRVHIKDTNGEMRIRIDPPDSVTKYEHMHIYDSKKNPLDIKGNIVDRKDPIAHIPWKNK